MYKEAVRFYGAVRRCHKKTATILATSVSEIRAIEDTLANMSDQEGASRSALHVVKLTAADILGADLSKPFEAHACAETKVPWSRLDRESAGYKHANGA